MAEGNAKSIPWKYCVVGNIKKSHVDESGTVRYGTAAYTGGTKVYLCGKFWNSASENIQVIGLNRRGRKFQVHYIPIHLIENVRCGKVYKPAVIQLMNNRESAIDWWGNTPEDRTQTQQFVAQWKEPRLTSE